MDHFFSILPANVPNIRELRIQSAKLRRVLMKDPSRLSSPFECTRAEGFPNEVSKEARQAR
jgi:hypothetical protein